MSTNESPQALDEGLELVLPGRGNPAGAGWDWIAQGWGLFKRAPLMWILSIVVVLVAAIVLNFIPLLGQVAFQLLQAVIAGGFVAACRSLETTGEFDIEHLFAGFSKRFVPLLVLGALLLAGWLAILVVFAGFVGFSLLGAILTGDPETVLAAATASGLAILLGVLVILVLMAPLMAAYWFAPALVMMHDVAPVAAMKASLFACLRNFVPFLVYSVVMLVLAVIASIPFGLGMLVWVPLAITSTYAAYRAIFTEESRPTQPGMA